MMSIANHYDTLEVSPKASAEVIRAAYKSLMQRHHPDKSVNGSASTPLASSIALAYEVLSDPQRRLAYDQTLLVRQPAPAPADPHAGRGLASHAVRRADPAPGRRSSAWYAPLLILCIIGAGASILVLSKKKTPAGSIPQERATSMPRPSATLPTEQPLAVTDEGQVRTLTGFATDLSVELNLDPTQSTAVHVLHIPSLGLRLSISEPDRWTQRIQAQRPAIIQQLLVTLAAAKYPELIKPEGDVYLKRLIEDSVTVVTGLDNSSALPATGQTKKEPQAVEALLPVSFSVL